MGLTQIFLLMMVISVVLAVAFCIASVSLSDSDESTFAYTAFALISAIFVAIALSGFVGSIWSYNINARDSINRCTESGGYVERIDERRVCLEEYPVIKWKV